MEGVFSFLFIICCSSLVWCYEPGDKVPPLKILDTLKGEPFLYNGQGDPLIIYAYNNEDGFSKYAWEYNNSVQWFLQGSPNITQYLFLSYSKEDSKSEVTRMRNQLLTMMTQLNFTTQQIQQWNNQLNFAVNPVSSLIDTWIPSLLQNWTTESKGISINGGGQLFWSTRVDAFYDWLPFPTDNTTSNIIYAGNGCQPLTINVTKHIVLLSMMPDTTCSYVTMVNNAQKAGAIGVIVFPYPDYIYTVEQINCTTSKDCAVPLDIPACMIPFNDGKRLLQVLQMDPKTMITYNTNLISGFYVGADSNGNFVELGWQKYADLRILSWEAQWLQYKTVLYYNLSLPARVIPIFNYSDMHGNGAITKVTIPPFQELSKYSLFNMDFALGCPGTRDTECDIWDYLVYLNVCCEDSSPCFELGRWITAFRRRTGRWLTPARQYLSMIAGKTCNFTASTVGSTHWHATLNLRFSEPSNDPVPWTTLPLFSGGTFNNNYNKKYTPINFVNPSPDPVKVELMAVITGHGSDSEGCAEFCVTSHHFSINNHFFNVTFNEAGTPLGCTMKIMEGAVPNEHGTWVYGRDGWCDGMNVRPWVVDVTEFVKTVNEVNYFGWFQGSDPKATEGAAYIVMSSWLVFYVNV